MRVSFVGSQAKMTNFQQENLGKTLKYKGCSEFIFCDLVGAELEAAEIAEREGIKIFTVYPVSDKNKRGFFKDKDKVTSNQRFETPYVARGDIQIKWHPTELYMPAHLNAYNGSEFIVACPKEFKFSIRSATWGVIKHVWKTKKDNIIIIPPIDRPSEEDIEKFYSQTGPGT
jgi:hypothetical protein